MASEAKVVCFSFILSSFFVGTASGSGEIRFVWKIFRYAGG